MLKHIPMMLWMAWTSLKRDRVVLMLTFALPIAFFSIFVGIFGSSVSGGGGMSKVNVALVDLDNSANSQRFVKALQKEGGLRIITTVAAGESTLPMTREGAEGMVKDGDASVGVVIPRGFGESFGSFNFAGSDGDADRADAVEILADKQRDPVAPQVVAGLMQKAAMTGAPDLLISNGIGQFEKYAGGLTPEQRAAMDKWIPELREEVDREDAAATQPATQAASGDSAGGDAASSGFDGLVKVNVVNVQQDHRSDWEAFVSFQVAQTAVMFLLFSMAGAAGSMLDEQENGTLERLLSSNMGMGGVLAGKWLVIALIGVAQLAVMFLWAWKPFGLSLFTPHHLAGWAIMSFATAAAGAGFGMVLATMCKSRGQLSGLSTIIILIMSAIGGSMFPRFMMSEQLQKIGLFTFNAWALDGYGKVFYDNLPLTELWPQVSVLVGLAAAFMFVARLLARRWEAA
jgi:ABC-2 type transport system permease protein